MKFELPELPYAIGDLEPHLTARTLQFHYERHHRGYLEKLRGLIEGTPHEEIELDDLVISASGEIFNNAAQVWNHTTGTRPELRLVCDLPEGVHR
jgi:Fe-Mn family superoxide dismutase